MTIDPKAKLGGFTLIQIRDFLRRHKFYSLRDEDAQDFFRTSSNRAAALITALEREGYLEKQRKTPYAKYWELTDAGSRLTTASAGRPISRHTAERKLAELIARAKEVNRNEKFAFIVERIAVIGSYLSDSPVMSDVDVVLSLRPRLTDKHAQQRLEAERINASGRSFANYSQRIFWPGEEVKRFLRARSRAYHFVDDYEKLLNDCPKRVVYQRQKDAER
jgi:DNA-binding PadR family transcriptional regulator